MNIKSILNKHRLFLLDAEGGEKANFSEKDLSGAVLSGLDLSYADFSGANLVFTDLSCSNLYRADLSDSNLYRANLEGTNLKETNLREAEISRANLTDITGKELYTFQGDKHFAYYCDGIIGIGCIFNITRVWLENYKEIGRENKYSEEQIEQYGKFIRRMST